MTAEIAAALEAAERGTSKTPHYSQIEAVAHAAGQALSCQIQSRASREVVALGKEKSPCPGCGIQCQVDVRRREVTPIDGRVDISEARCHCNRCRRTFFPQRETLGSSSRELTPQLVQRIVHAAAETRSFERAAIALNEIDGCAVSAKTIERVAHEVGEELSILRDQGNGALVKSNEAAPALAVAQSGGGRIHTREADHGPGVTGQAWRKTKDACLVRLSITVSEADPSRSCPALFVTP